MSFRDCIDNGQAEGVIEAGRADDLRANYDRLYAEYKTTMSEAEAARKAGKETFETAEYASAERKRRVALSRAVQRERLKELEDNNLKY